MQRRARLCRGLHAGRLRLQGLMDEVESYSNLWVQREGRVWLVATLRHHWFEQILYIWKPISHQKRKIYIAGQCSIPFWTRSVIILVEINLLNIQLELIKNVRNDINRGGGRADDEGWGWGSLLKSLLVMNVAQVWTDGFYRFSIKLL